MPVCEWYIELKISLYYDYTMFWRLCLNYIIKSVAITLYFVNYFLSFNPYLSVYHIQILIETIAYWWSYTKIENIKKKLCI